MSKAPTRSAMQQQQPMMMNMAVQEKSMPSNTLMSNK